MADRRAAGRGGRADPGRRRTARGSPRCPPRCARRARAWGPPPGELYVDCPATRRARSCSPRSPPATWCCWSSRRAGSGRTRWPSTTTRTCRRATTTWPPTGGWSDGVRRARRGAPGQARQPGMAAGQGPRPVRRVRPRRGPRRPAADLPVHRQRPRRGHPGQAAGARRDRRPPGAADGPRRDLRRPGPAGAAARRVRDSRRARPGQAARRAGPDLDADPGRRLRPRPRPGRPPARRKSSTTSCCTSTATCARSRTRRSATGCTSSAARRPASAGSNLVLAVLRAPQVWGGAAGALPGLRQALGLAEDASRPRTTDAGRGHRPGAGRAHRRRGLAARRPSTRSAASSASTALAERPVAAVLGFAAAELVPRLARTDRGDRPRSCARWTAGTCRPARRGSPTRGLVNVLPTGRNFYSVDPKAIPSRLAWDTGWRWPSRCWPATAPTPARARARSGCRCGAPPRCAPSGDDIAEVLALLGRPAGVGRGRRRVTGLEVIRPGRARPAPRSTSRVRICGFFRDAFPHVVALLDDAVTAGRRPGRAGRAELRARARAGRPGRARRPAPRHHPDLRLQARRYGAGLLPLIDSRTWRDDADLAEVYALWGGYAYGRGLDGRAAREDMEAAFRRIAVAVKNTDTREHDIVDSDDYFQYHGGMVADGPRAHRQRAARLRRRLAPGPTRCAPARWARRPARVFRARVVNPKWIAAMRRHGYKGAFELAATVDYLFGYDATAGVVDDWMYEQLAASVRASTRTTREFLERVNPWALRGITERLLEAADRGLWAEPEPATLDRLQRRLPGHRGRAGGRPEGGGAVHRSREPVSATRSPRCVGRTTCGWRCCSTRSPRRSAACWSAARRAPPSPRRARRWPRCCPASASWPAAGSAATRPRPTRPARTARTRPSAAAEHRPARLVELPVGATEDRVVGTLDLERALAERRRGLRAGAARRRAPRRAVRRRGQPAARPPGRPAAGRRRDGLRDVEREGVSVQPRRPVPAGRHDEPGGGRAAPAAARPVRADRRGRAPAADPASARRGGPRAGSPTTPTRRLRRRAGPRPTQSSPPGGRRPAPASRVELPDAALRQIAEVCAAFDVDGMRADIVTARTAIAHAAWHGRDRVTVDDVRVAARLALPHRRRRDPFDDPGLDEKRTRRGAAARPGRPDPDPGRHRPAPRPALTRTAARRAADRPAAVARAAATRVAGGPVAGPRAPPQRRRRRPGRDPGRRRGADRAGSRARPAGRTRPAQASRRLTGAASRVRRPAGRPDRHRQRWRPGSAGLARRRAAAPAGERPPGRATRRASLGRLHLPAAGRRRRPGGPGAVTGRDLRREAAPRPRGQPGRLLVDASGSMAARRRMPAVKATAVLSLLTDAYQRRDRVALLAFRGRGATVVVPPTRSSVLAARAAGRAADRRAYPAGGGAGRGPRPDPAGALARPGPAPAGARRHRRPGHRRARPLGRARQAAAAAGRDRQRRAWTPRTGRCGSAWPPRWPPTWARTP